ncbi:MAG TPA: hypothetical protein VFD81_09325, partial [Methylomirabilota bacterium]|nr:hypothetical protein [Methylomirabilota bacterium]
MKRHAGLALGDVFANASLVQVERPFDLLRRQRAHRLRERASPPRRGDTPERETAENPDRHSPVHASFDAATRRRVYRGPGRFVTARRGLALRVL